MKRLFSLLLAILMVLPILASCDDFTITLDANLNAPDFSKQTEASTTLESTDSDSVDIDPDLVGGNSETTGNGGNGGSGTWDDDYYFPEKPVIKPSKTETTETEGSKDSTAITYPSVETQTETVISEFEEVEPFIVYACIDTKIFEYPMINSTSIKSIDRSSLMMVVERKDTEGDKWFKVTYGNYSGYIPQDFVSENKDDTIFNNYSEDKQKYIKISGDESLNITLSVYQFPVISEFLDQNILVLSYAQTANNELKLVGESQSNLWYVVSYNGNFYFIKLTDAVRRFLTFINVSQDSDETTSDINETMSDIVTEDTSIYDDITLEDIINPDNYEGSDIPENVGFGAYEFNMLVDTTNFNKEFVAESDGDLIKDAVVNRQEWIEQYVDIYFNFTETVGGYNNMESYAAEIEIASQVGQPYDLALAYNLTPPVVAAKGLSKDLSASSNLNLDSTTKAYWGNTFRNEIQIQGRIFWMSDNSSWNNIRNMLCMYVNLEYFSRINEGKTKDDLYAMVDNKTWTMDNLMALIQESYDDSTLDNTVDDGDSFGLQAAESPAWLDNWLYAGGFRHTKQNSDGLYEWTWGDQDLISFVDWWQEMLNNSNVDKQDNTQYKMFKEDRAMFALSTIGMGEQNIELDYTILPLPMYKSSIKNGYSTPFSNTYSSYLIPKACTSVQFERSATILELLAAEANRRIAPVYFEIYIKRNIGTNDSDVQRMFNIIRNSIVFDIGYLHGTSLTVENLTNDGSTAEVFIMLRRTWAGAQGYYNIETVWAEIGSTATQKLSALMVNLVDY